MVFAAYPILVLHLGRAFGPYFQAPPWGFCMNTQLHCGTFVAFPKQNEKGPTNSQGDGGGGGMGTLGID